MLNADEAFLYCASLDRKGGATDRHGSLEKGARDSVDDDLLWVHFDTQNDQARRWLTNDDSVDANVVETLLAVETRPRSFTSPEGLLVVLRAVNSSPGQDPEDMVSMRVWVEQNRVISSQRRNLLAVKDVYDSLAKGKGPASSGTLLVALIERVADRIGAFVDQIEDRITDAEDSLIGADYNDFRKTLSDLRRQTAAVRRFMAPQRDALDRMYRQPGPWVSEEESTSLREEADRITRYLEDLDLARERAIVLQEEFLSTIAQEQNSRMYVLSIVAAVFLPLSFLTGLLGMNVGGLPGTESPQGFLWSAALMVGAGAGLYVYFKRKNWI